MSKIDAAKFVLQCQNWPELAIPIATHKTLTRVILKNGIRFESYDMHWPDIYGIFFQNWYTPPFLPIEKNDVVVDIGANIGVFTVFAALRTQNTVYAFEPFPSTFETLEQNVRANGLRNVIPYQCAVSDSNGTELLFEADGSRSHRLKKVARGEDENYIEVPSITLQDFMDKNHLEQIDFLKMDCEGAEAIILKSTSRDYLQRIRKIVMEVHDGISKIKHDQIRELLEEADFSTKVDLGDSKSQVDLLSAWRS